MKKFVIGKDGFSLPSTLVTSTQAILARKRSGKSYTASVMAEEMLEQHQQVVVIDPTSAWYGLRSSADGESQGYPVVVFGGKHADAPLAFMAGREMAKASASMEARIMSNLKAPFPWFGGKSKVSDLVWSRFGDVPNYIEPFFGSGAVLLGRPHEASTETINDLDCMVANF